MDQSAYEALKAGITNKKTDITKAYNNIIKPEANRHGKKQLMTSIHYNTEAIGQILNQLNDVTSKCMAQMMTTDVENVSHKSLLEQETTGL